MIRYFFSSQLRQNISANMAVFGINFIISLVALPIYLHYLGFEKYGIWLVLTTVMAFAQMGNLGISSAITKFVAEYYEQGNEKSIERYVTSAMFGMSVSGSLILLLIISFRTQIISAFKLGAENSVLATNLLPYIGALTLYIFLVQIVAATLSGLNRMDLAGCFQLGGRCVAVISATLLLKSGYGIQSLLIANCLSSITYHFLCSFYVRRLISIRFYKIKNINKDSLKQLIKFGGGIMGGRGMDMFLVPFNKLMLSRFIGVEAIPIYDISFSIAVNVRGIAASGLAALTPEVSRLSVLASSGGEKIRQIYRRAMRLISLCGIPPFAIVMLFATPLLQFWLKNNFHPLLPAILRILLLGTFFNLLGIPASYIILGLGYSNSIFFSSMIKSGLNFLIILFILSINTALSIQTIAWATVIGMGCSTFYLLFKLHTSIFSIKEPCKNK